MTDTLVAMGAVLAWVGGYAMACWIWPFAACKRCKGSGRKKSPSGRAFRTCKKCKGTGKRIRTGRRIFNWLRVLRSEGT